VALEYMASVGGHADNPRRSEDAREEGEEGEEGEGRLICAYAGGLLN
jgi:hypothetical protein